MFRWNFLCSSLCHFQWTPLERLWIQTRCNLLFRYLYTLLRFSVSFLFSRLNSPSSLSLSSYEMCFSSSMICSFTRLSPVCLCLSCTGEPISVPRTPDISHQSWVEEKNHPPQPAGSTLSRAIQDIVSLLCHKIYSWPVWCPLESQVLFCIEAFQLGSPQHILVPGVIHPQVKDFATTLAELLAVPIRPFM